MVECSVDLRTKWKRQTSLGLEMMTENQRQAGGEPQSPLYPAALQVSPQSALEIYYRNQLRQLPALSLPLVSPLVLQNTQYSSYLAQLAVRARTASSSSPASSPPSQRSSTSSPKTDEASGQSSKTEYQRGTN